MAGALEGDVFIGRRAQEFRGLLKIKYPMEHGIVTDWDDMERIWSWVYAEELGTLSEEVSTLNPTPKRLNKRDCQQHPVLLTEAPLNPRSNRDVAAQIFFDTFNVPALFTSVQAVLSLYVISLLCFTKTRSMYVYFGSDIRPGGQRGLCLIRGMA
jgi:centractin